MSSWVTTSEHEQKRYTLLQPGSHSARTGPNFQIQATWRDLEWIIGEISHSEYVAVDFETRGGDYSNEISIVGIGLAWDSGSAYLHWIDLFPSSRERLVDSLSRHTGLLAHNVYFDGGVVRKVIGRAWNWHACTYSLLAHLANEGHPDQSWGLKSAMTELFGWENSNETELDLWLVTHGFYKGNRRINNDYNYLATEFSTGNLKPDKGEIWRAPADILGKYCVLDAEACYLLYTRILKPEADSFSAFSEYFHRDVMHLITTLIEQKIHGIPVSRQGLLSRSVDLHVDIMKLEKKFRNHPETSATIMCMEASMREELMGKEPAKLKKDGTVSKNWEKWHQKLSDAVEGKLPEYNFNIQSGPQLRELLYTRMGFEVRARTDNGDPAVGIKTLKHMGEVGQILIDRAYSAKELSYIEDYLARTENRATIHPSFRTPGTMTGRLSSKEPNVQQIPKSKAVMSLFHARPGHVWVDLDFAALEPVVLAEFSQDENLLRLYGNGAPNNDIYLFTGSFIPGMGDLIRDAGYDPFNPTLEGLANAKKECKSIRSICKTVVLACQYGAGVNKVMSVLEQDDVFLPNEQVELIHSTYWDTFAGVKDFSKSLYYEWRRNGGWVLNGMGRPMCLPENMTKDILNRFVQSTGHDILVKYIRILSNRLDQCLWGKWKPLIIDWHDAATIEVPEEHAELARIVMDQCVQELNEQLQGTINLRGTAEIGYSLADVKSPEE